MDEILSDIKLKSITWVKLHKHLSSQYSLTKAILFRSVNQAILNSISDTSKKLQFELWLNNKPNTLLFVNPQHNFRIHYDIGFALAIILQNIHDIDEEILACRPSSIDLTTSQLEKLNVHSFVECAEKLKTFGILVHAKALAVMVLGALIQLPNSVINNQWKAL
ncbi:MAG: hypothetical protein ACON5A_05690 [Candidatus Comchoanobacterales bacterium]